ncbi:MAG: hypothetical protein ACE5R4_00480 [Armatimonadota bacterium]
MQDDAGTTTERLLIGRLASQRCWTLAATALVLLTAGLPALAQPTFPTTGYLPILVDPEEPAIADKLDIIAVSYQADATYAYFELTVQDGAKQGISLASERFYLYIDLDDDGLADRLLRNTSANNSTLDSWNGTQWVTFASAWAEDPNDTPDDHVYFACYIADIGFGDFTLVASAQDQPSFDPTIRDPNNDPDMDEVTGDSSNPSPVVVSDFRVEHAVGRLTFSWRAGADADVAGFNLYVIGGDGQGRSRLNQPLVRVRSALTQSSYTFVCAGEDLGPETYELEAVGLDGSTKTAVIAASGDGD